MMHDRVVFAYDFQPLHFRPSLSKFGNDETKLIIGISIDIYIVDDAVMVIWLLTIWMCTRFCGFFYLLQRYQLPSIVIHRVTVCHNDERHLIKDFNKRKEWNYFNNCDKRNHTKGSYDQIVRQNECLKLCLCEYCPFINIKLW